MKQQNKASLFLMELIVALLFFALASAICIQMFVKAKTMNEESVLKHHASIAASNIAETYRSEQLHTIYEIKKEGVLYFDDTWSYPSAKPTTNKAYLQENNNTLKIQLYYQNKLIYSLDCKHYKQRTVQE